MKYKTKYKISRLEYRNHKESYSQYINGPQLLDYVSYQLKIKQVFIPNIFLLICL